MYYDGILNPMTDVTRILSQIEQGDAKAADQLLPLVYDELRKLAAAKLANERPGQTLQATALVHDAFIRLVDAENVQDWNSRGHFFGAAAEAMRRILVENARRKAGPKAGGGRQRLDLSHVEPVADTPDLDVLALNEALDKLAIKDPRKAELVKLRFFVGLTNEETAQALGITPRTAFADWRYARAWLHTEMTSGGDTTPDQDS